MDCAHAVKLLKESSTPHLKKEKMERFGILPKSALCVANPEIRRIGRLCGKSHSLALELWKTGIHEARILAGLVDEAESVSERQMDSWVKDFDSWGVCDCTCMNLFDRTPFAYKKAFEWSSRKEEFVKRAGFAMMAALAVHDKEAKNEKLAQFFPVIIREARDERNFAKKAVNWALRQIGKRNPVLRQKAIETAMKIQKLDSKSAKWIANGALRELRGKKN